MDKMNTTENVEIKDESVGSVGIEPGQKIQVDLSEEEKVRMEEVKALVDAERLEPTTAMNILINAVQVAFDSEMFNDLDKYLIAKSLNSFKEYVDRGEDIVLKVA
jgi:hypothetical protein